MSDVPAIQVKQSIFIQYPRRILVSLWFFVIVLGVIHTLVYFDIGFFYSVRYTPSRTAYTDLLGYSFLIDFEPGIYFWMLLILLLLVQSLILRTVHTLKWLTYIIMSFGFMIMSTMLTDIVTVYVLE